MAKKNITFSLDEKTIEKLNYYSSITGKTKVSFLEDALDNEFNSVKFKRSGGMTLKIPNPNRANVMTETEKQYLLSTLREAPEGAPERLQTLKNNIGLELIAKFLEDRFSDSEARKKELEDNFYQDLLFESNVSDNI